MLLLIGPFIVNSETLCCGCVREREPRYIWYQEWDCIVSSRHRTTETETLREASTVAGEVKMATRAASK